VSNEPALKILYIEDDAANFELVARVLRATGRYEVIGASDGAAGLELVRTEKPALVLVDLDVPAINGFEVTRQIKASDAAEISKIPVVAISANVLTNERELALDAGCADFIEKPLDIRQFRQQIEALVSAAAPEP